MKPTDNRHRIVRTEVIIDNERTCPVIGIRYIDNYPSNRKTSPF